jgi:cation-transporting ATPase 13A2
VQHGLDEFARTQRLTLFGNNEIDIQAKSVMSLLVDEVGSLSPALPHEAIQHIHIEQIIHPFYVFQIASIFLWSIDDYYYYAFCIALISTLSISTTLIDTRKV